MIGQAQGVVAGAGGDDAAAALVGGELEEFVAGAAFFEAAGHLEVVELAVDLGVAELGEAEAVGAGGVVDGVADAGAGGLDVGEGEHG